MNLLSLAMTGMVSDPSQGSGGGGGNGVPPGSAQIQIELDGLTGKPSAVPESAWVSAGGAISWACAEPFEIILKLMWANEMVSRRSSNKGGDQHTLEVQAGSIDGRYSYGIKVGDQEVDPDVIIGPRVQNQ